MRYICTRNNQEKVSFKEAVLNGLSNQGGLYFPEQIPTLPADFFKHIGQLSNQEIAFHVLKPFVEGTFTDAVLQEIIKETLSFPLPVVKIQDNQYILELFHGPTQAFKDVGARFMSRCLSKLYQSNQEEVTVLVATSGDTGSAVANGFLGVPGVNVKIAFPKGKISAYQEYQMSSLGNNIEAVEVDGNFDDCQSLVKQALNDTDLRKKVNLSSANSINIARLLPQMLYYFFAYQQLQKVDPAKQLIFSVPSGNLGNLCAGLTAQKMGLPVAHFLAALNANDTFLNYLQTGTYNAKKSVATYSSAMDVGNPSNFERIDYLYQNNHNTVLRHLTAYSFDDDATIEEIKSCYHQHHYQLDPHAAVAKLALEKHPKQEHCIGVLLGTAHPRKFEDVMAKAIPDFATDKVDLSQCKKTPINNNYDAWRELILGE